MSQSSESQPSNEDRALVTRMGEVVDAGELGTGLDLAAGARAQRRADFGRQLLQAALANDEFMRRQWDKAEKAWLDTKGRLSGSDNTQRTYLRVLAAWKDFVAVQRNEEGFPLQLWQVEAQHVRAWQGWLREVGRLDTEAHAVRGSGLAENTINQYLSVVSSFYSFVIAEKVMVSGVEGCLFADVTGATRANPFKHGNIERGSIEGYERAKLLDHDDLGRLLRVLEAKSGTVSGARNYALVLTYLLTGYRSQEVVRMQWKHLRPSRVQRDVVVYAWVGKGNKKADEPIPEDAWNAVVHYLKLSGRWVPGVDAMDQAIDADEYIFKATTTRTLRLLKNVSKRVDERTGNEPLSGKSALRVLRTALRNAGVREAESYRVHDLRHTFAVMMLEDGASETELMLQLHHSSLETTGHYTKTMRQRKTDKVNTHSRRLYQQMRAFADIE